MHKTMHSLTGKDSVVEISYAARCGAISWPVAGLVQAGINHFLNRKSAGVRRAPFVAGWLLVVEFIFTLAMALKCYPLLPGGLLAIEALLIGMTARPRRDEIAGNLECCSCDVHGGGYYFMKQLLLFVFTRLLLGIRSKMLLSLAFCLRQPSSRPFSMR
ncbi:sodium/proton antiporter [Klebsiella pneumoniae]|uniref:Sodium/proton antiporter n=1 Tax=Klebsiella pneumoniae TaxID=573 RepID=A0A2X3HFP4_KLEPN|nr:sodium/proton antiporter [Klebsiella pneumoniae]